MCHFISSFIGKKSCPEKTSEAPAPLPSCESTDTVSSPAEDPYADFLLQQKKREIEWASNRAAKKVKVAGSESIPETSSSRRDDDDISSVRKQLDAKTEECSQLSKQLLDLKQANADAAKSRKETQESFYKVSKKLSKLQF